MSATLLKKYATYKGSDIEWLSEIPSHWRITRNKDIFFERGSLSQSARVRQFQAPNPSAFQ